MNVKNLCEKCEEFKGVNATFKTYFKKMKHFLMSFVYYFHYSWIGFVKNSRYSEL